MSVFVQVIDGTYGRPAAGVAVRLERDVEGVWTEQRRDMTGDDGNIVRLCDGKLTRGTYRLEFDVDSYFSSLGIAPFCPTVAMKFRMSDPAQLHRISLIITPSAYFAYQH
jgi:5-hydroxyisourate hydrolase